MLRDLKSLEHYTVRATDGDIGHVADFLFDDQRWAIRYLVVASSLHLDWREALISPISFREADWNTRQFHLALTIDKIRNSPGLDVDKPVSRQHERAYHQYFGYPYYWGYSGLWGAGSYPGILAADTWTTADDETAPPKPGDLHLRSCNEVRGYRVQGTDDAIGHIEGFLLDDATWEVRYLVINTSNWGWGKQVLVAPQWAPQISWDERKVYVNITRQQVKDSPEWDGKAAVDRDYATRLHAHYGRTTDWARGDPTKASQQNSRPPA